MFPKYNMHLLLQAKASRRLTYGSYCYADLLNILALYGSLLVDEDKTVLAESPYEEPISSALEMICHISLSPVANRNLSKSILSN